MSINLQITADSPDELFTTLRGLVAGLSTGASPVAITVAQQCRPAARSGISPAGSIREDFDHDAHAAPIRRPVAVNAAPAGE